VAKVLLHLYSNKKTTMKKHLLIAASLFVAAISSNAQIINPNFDTWSTDAFATNAKDPNSGNGSTGWWDFNMLNWSLIGGSPVSVFQDSTTTYNGAKYSAKIVTVPLTSTSWGYIKKYGVPDTMGIVMTANITASTAVSVKTGEPWNNRLTQFSFYYQYTPNGVDTASCSVVVSSTTGAVRTTIGAGELKISAATSTWTLGTVNMTYLNGNMPDTILIQFSSSSLLSKPKVGSTLLVDGVSTVDGVNELHAASASVNVYPDPASTEVNLSVSSTDMANYANIYDITGKKLSSFEVRNNFATVNTSAFAPGLYIYQLYDKSGSLMKTGKFSVAK
jgi:hypothetical protein